MKSYEKWFIICMSPFLSAIIGGCLFMIISIAGWQKFLIGLGITIVGMTIIVVWVKFCMKKIVKGIIEEK
jgi:hypothetical protein